METLYEDYVAAGIRNQTAQEQQEFNLFTQLKPTLKRDGDLWCVIWSEGSSDAIAGYGNSPHLAIMNFNAQWYKEIQIPNESTTSGG